MLLYLIFGLNLTYANNGFSSDSLVSEKYLINSFPLVTQDKTASLHFDSNEFEGVKRAIEDLQTDIESVTNKKPELMSNVMFGSTPVIIGTIGKNKWIDKLIETNKINRNDLIGKWESFVITTIKNPFEGVQQALVIAGSDKRGTIYGIYELSRQLGVSPWYWWADVPPLKRNEAYVPQTYFASGEPKVKYRGIFINDEIPCMKSWANEKFGGMNSKMYAHVYELLLRLRANYLWPGMWGSFREYNPTVPLLFDENGKYEGISFNEDDIYNPRLADEYGIIIGTSHHEPMQRSQQEWLRNKKKYGNGEWNYVTNKAGIKKFFREGIEHTKDYESLITLGMRGDDDKPMVDAGSVAQNFKILEGIIADQRKIIKEVTGKPLAKTPQVWTLYKEVLEYYDLGLKVPDDVIVLLCDDDWGDVRRLPELNTRIRPGGYGMYYHVGYYGAPRASKWLNNTQIQHMWEQLQLTYDYGVDKIWILNVGDIKPNEFSMDFFLKMAWNPKRFNETNLMDYTRDFCAQQFGESQANMAAQILNTYNKYAARMFAEMLDDKTYNLSTGEFKMVKDEFLALETMALRQFSTLPVGVKDAYQQLILFPVQAMANIYDMYYAVAMNKKMAALKDSSANFWADHAEYCFRRDAELCKDYNQNMSNGKWNHMMDQVHIGYTSWHPPVENIKPTVIRLKPNEVKRDACVFDEENSVVVIEAEHYYSTKNAKNATWQIIPDFGRTLSGLTLLPYTQSTEGACVTYKMNLKTKVSQVKIHAIFDCTLPFKKGGHSISAEFEGSSKETISINEDLTWKNNYSKMYPAAGERIIEKQFTLQLPENKNGIYILKLYPHAPGIVLQKIIVDCGGYKDTHLGMIESPYKRE